MLTTVVDYRLDALVFVLFSLSLMVSVRFWLLRRHRVGAFPLGLPTLLTAVILAGIAAAELAEQTERDGLRNMLEGIAPTYAQELELMGHSRIQPRTPVDDPLYLSLIEAQKRWLSANRTVNDIYTLRRLPDGTVILLVDSETDYDHDGVFEGEREQRRPIGEPCKPTPGMLRCFQMGAEVFDDDLTPDRWGIFISAYAPLRDAQGNVEAILGVDYDAGAWTENILIRRGVALGGPFVLVIGLVLFSATSQITRTELERRIAAEKQKEALQAELLDASRKAGMAEVAAGVLHNVGNVLNSVNVSANLVSQRIQSSRVQGVGKAADLLNRHSSDLPAFFSRDPKARQLPDYLQQLAGVLQDEQRATLEEMSHLDRSVDHIKQIVASQQAYAKSAPMIEEFQMSDAVEDALRISGLSTNSSGIEIVRHFYDCPPLRAERHAVLQILVNLISNARKAILKDEISIRRITFRVTAEAVEGKPGCCLDVIDTGIGIPAEQLPKIFQHGFTTSREGHGFGLHSAGNDARRLGGSLSCASEGLGRGVTFTLRLPLVAVEQPEPHRAA